MKKIILATVIITTLTIIFVKQNNKIYLLETNQTQTDNKTVPIEISKSKVINLSNQELKSIPMSVFSKTDIEALDVSNNSLTGSIQSQIGQLTKLRILNASKNKMTGLPAEVGQLQNLEILDLSNNKITGLPYELGNLKNLKVLDLSGNDYSKQDLDTIRKTLPENVNIIVD